MNKLRIQDVSLNVQNGKVLYKNEGGYTKNAALFAHEKSSVRFYIPRSVGTVSVTVRAYNETRDSRFEMNADWSALSKGCDVYLLENVFEVGLHFYSLHIKTSHGDLYGYKGSGNEIFFSRNNFGGDFQLTVSEFTHDAPTSFLGGIIYHVFVDRFARSNKSHAKRGTVIDDYSKGIPEYPAYSGAPLKNNTFWGGDLYGLADKLDYIASLGANVIYLSPIFESPSNHKYDTADYLSVDEAFGGEAALRHLINEAHKRKIRIILDGVFNHTGADSLYFNRYGTYGEGGAYQTKDSPFYPWYEFQSHPDKYTCWWDIEILPRINTRIPECADFFVGDNGVISRYTEMGIDGFRLDVADELSDDFIARIKSRLAKKSADTILYGEVWEDASNKIAYSERKRYYLGSELDGVMNYPLRRGIIDYLTLRKIDTLEYALTEIIYNAPKRIRDLQMNLLGTHDTERILTSLGGESSEGLSNDVLVSKRMSADERSLALARLKLAYTVLATLPGIPTIFYGDEVGLEGYSDPFNRMPYPWGKEDIDLLGFYKKVGKLRRKSRIYKDGEFSLVLLTSDTLVFSRSIENEYLLTVVNNSSKEISLELSDEATAMLGKTKKAKAFTLLPLSAEIYRLASENPFITLNNGE